MGTKDIPRYNTQDEKDHHDYSMGAAGQPTNSALGDAARSSRHKEKPYGSSQHSSATSTRRSNGTSPSIGGGLKTLFIALTAIGVLGNLLSDKDEEPSYEKTDYTIDELSEIYSDKTQSPAAKTQSLSANHEPTTTAPSAAGWTVGKTYLGPIDYKSTYLVHVEPSKASEETWNPKDFNERMDEKTLYLSGAAGIPMEYNYNIPEHRIGGDIGILVREHLVYLELKELQKRNLVNPLLQIPEPTMPSISVEAIADEYASQLEKIAPNTPELSQ